MTHLLADLGWVDLDLGCPTVMLGQHRSCSTAQRPVEHPKSKSTQPRSARRWVTLYTYTIRLTLIRTNSCYLNPVTHETTHCAMANVFRDTKIMRMAHSELLIMPPLSLSISQYFRTRNWTDFTSLPEVLFYPPVTQCQLSRSFVIYYPDIDLKF